MNNKRYGRIITGIALVLVAVMLVPMFFFGKGREQIKIPEEYKDGITVYENEDYIYVPECEHLKYEEEEHQIYYDNEMIVYLKQELPDEEKIELANAVDGTIVGELGEGLSMMQIAFEETDYPGICEKIETLMEYDTVLCAGCDTSFELENFSYQDENPWSADKNTPISDKGNEDNPEGNDWWAEAIGAYRAWEWLSLVENGGGSSVNVGIIDSGFDLDHEEFEGRISLMKEYSGNDQADIHGTAVAGIIGAANNDVGLHGVCSAADMTCIRNQGSGILKEDMSLNIPNFARMINLMAVKKMKAVNLSWGLESPVSGEEYRSYLVLEKLGTEVGDTRIQWGRDYEEYLEICREQAKVSAETCILILDKILEGENSEILYVQAAGNGWNNGGTGHEAERYAGLFDSVTEKVYQSMKTSGLCHSYDEIKEHILVVGAVDNVRDGAGNYQMTQYSNHGESLDLCAPAGKESIFTTTVDGYMDDFWGTSAAAPMVTGSAALLWQITPELSAAQVKNYLVESANQEAYGYYFPETRRYPMLNIGNAVEWVLRETDVTIDAEELLMSWLDELAVKLGVIEVGTEEYASKGAPLEHVVPYERLKGLLAATMEDYDGDGEQELLVVGAEPIFYKVGEDSSASKSNVTVDIYDVQNGKVECASVVIPVLALSDTLYQRSFHMFQTKDEQGVKLYFDHFFHMNSQTFSVIQLEYKDGLLAVTDGAEVSEFAYSSNCWKAISNDACSTILGRQDASGNEGWKLQKDAFWEDYGSSFEKGTKAVIQAYEDILDGMGLKDTKICAQYGEQEGTSVQNLYDRSYLKPADHYTCSAGTITEICSVIAPYAQGGVTLTVEDETSLLDVYRTGNGGQE